ncbi:hypothetical protein [Comamonas antarctica]|uniref:hypothetical protein n=1 Tax=Comamonas antarctica TaxID=2743470 RepID=UPI0028E3C812|nr:hypothetical protein [Comamonas antarctica]
MNAQPTGLLSPFDQQNQQPTGLTGLLSTPVAQGLLAAGLGAMGSRGSTMQAIGRGGLLGMSVLGQAQERQDNSLLENAKRKMAEVQRQQQQEAWASAKPKEGGGFDWNYQELLRTGAAKPADLPHLQSAGQPQIHEYQTVRGPDGAVTRVGFTKDGRTINTGATPFSEFKTLDFGGNQGAFDPITGAVYDLGRKTQTYGDQVAGRNAGTAERRLQWDMSQPSEAGKPPAGYRWKPDRSGLEAIPGGPADEKATLAGEKTVQRQQGAILQASRMIESVDTALGQLDNAFTTGISGAMAAKVPGSSANDLRATLGTIKANLGFAELQAMREASPTGGALGSVAVQELMALQSTVANLEPNQSEAQLRTNLGKVKTHFNNMREILQGRMPQGYGAGGQTWGAVAQEYEKQGMPREVIRQVLTQQGQDPAKWGY